MRRAFLIIALVCMLLLALVSARLLTATVTSGPLETATAFIRERLSLAADACPGGMQQLAFFHDLFQAKEFTQDPAFDVNGKNGVTEMDGLVFAQAMYGIVQTCIPATCDARARTVAWADANEDGTVSEAETETVLTGLFDWLDSDTPDAALLIDADCNGQKNDNDMTLLLQNLLLLLPQ